jgi:cell division protein FtsA
VGVRGISQLVAGPQFAAGVGLVQFGAKALFAARSDEGSAPEPARVQRIQRPLATASVEETLEVVQAKKNGRFWNWLRAAF